jgi:hypothetical protein
VQNSSFISDFRCSKFPEICSIIVQKPPNAQIKHSLRNFEHSKWLIFPLSYRLLSLLGAKIEHFERNAKDNVKTKRADSTFTVSPLIFTFLLFHLFTFTAAHTPYNW